MSLDVRPPPIRSGVADDTSDRSGSVRPFKTIIFASLMIALGAAAGWVWVSNQDQQFDATARVSFTDWIEPGATDAAREAILANAETDIVGAVSAAFSATDVEFVTPAGRNFIDVSARSRASDVAIAAANDAAERVVAAETATQLSLLGADIARYTGDISEIGVTVADLETQMDDALAREAAAEGRRSVASTPADIEAAIVAAREASDDYWNLSRRRNALVDEQNGLERSVLRLQSELDDPTDLAVTAPAIEATAAYQQSPTLALLGGAAAGAALALLVMVLADARNRQ